MKNYLNVPKETICNIKVPVDKFYKEKDICKKDVLSIEWYASLKPELIGAISSINEDVRYEEIQIFIVEIASMSDIYALARPIFKGIKYPCLLLLHDSEQEKYCLVSCPFSPGKVEYNNNILKSMRFSHWIHIDIMSQKGQACLDNINIIINSKSSIEAIYNSICNEITNFCLRGITKKKVSDIYLFLVGGIYKPEQELLEKYCSPYKKYFPIDNSKSSKYNKNCRTSRFIYRYDYEDVWYCLCKSDHMKKIIEKRRFRDFEDLLYSVDEYFERYTIS